MLVTCLHMNLLIISSFNFYSNPEGNETARPWGCREPLKVFWMNIFQVGVYINKLKQYIYTEAAVGEGDGRGFSCSNIH